MAQVANLNTKLSLESASFISGIEKSRGAVRSLIASLDPAAAAQAKFNRETQLLDGALKRGQISAEAYGKGMEILRQRMTAATTAQGEVVRSSGNVRAGMQQLGFQLGDVATQWASGTRPMVIFAQQSGQVIQALGMMTNSTKGLLGFLGGPWGQILTAAAVVMIPLINNLFESADAADAAKGGLLGYIDALKRLQDQGGAFKFGSDEFAKVSKEALLAEARVVQLTKRLASMKNVAPIAIGPGGPAPVSNATVQVQLDKAIADRDARRSDLNALLIQQRNRAANDAPGTTRSGGGGAGGGRRSSGAPSAAAKVERAESQYADELGRLRVDSLRAYADLTGSVEKRYEAEMAELAESRASFDRRIAADDALSSAQRATLTAEREKADASKRQAVEASRQEALDKETFAFMRAANESAQEIARFELENARTAGQRRDGQLRLLELQRRLEEAQLKLVIATEKTGSEAYSQAQLGLSTLDRRYGMMAGQARRDTMGPMESHLDSLPKSAEELNEAYQNVAADGLQSLNDGLADAITGSRSLGDVFKSVANQIIADLARIAIQKAITGAIGNALGTAFGGGGTGIASSAGSTASSTGASMVPKFAGGGMFGVGGKPGVDNHVLSVDGIPRAMVSANENIKVGYGGGSGVARVEIVEAPGFAARVVGISGAVSIRTVGASNRAGAKRQTRRLA
jgi:lambda family phage tail tape measure protein